MTTKIKTDDVQAKDLKDLSWESDQISGSLDVVFQHSQKIATDFVGWYIRNKTKKKRIAKSLRMWAVIAVGVAGVIPVMSMILDEMQFTWPLNAGWASVLFGFAGVLVGLDSFFGYSSAWARYTDAELRIQARLHTFQFTWMSATTAWEDGTPSSEDARKLLEQAQKFVSDVDAIVKSETDEWATEFKSVIRRFDENTTQPRGG